MLLTIAAVIFCNVAIAIEHDIRWLTPLIVWIVTLLVADDELTRERER